MLGNETFPFAQRNLTVGLLGFYGVFFVCVFLFFPKLT